MLSFIYAVLSDFSLIIFVACCIAWLALRTRVLAAYRQFMWAEGDAIDRACQRYESLKQWQNWCGALTLCAYALVFFALIIGAERNSLGIVLMIGIALGMWTLSVAGSFSRSQVLKQVAEARSKKLREAMQEEAEARLHRREQRSTVIDHDAKIDGRDHKLALAASKAPRTTRNSNNLHREHTMSRSLFKAKPKFAIAVGNHVYLTEAKAQELDPNASGPLKAEVKSIALGADLSMEYTVQVEGSEQEIEVGTADLVRNAKGYTWVQETDGDYNPDAAGS